MLTIFQSIFLGALQGITEFLPVSSSGHLVVVQQLFGWNSEGNIIVAFDVALHVGTLFAVLAIYWKDIVDILKGKSWRLLGLLILATIPAVIVGFSIKHTIEALFSSARAVGFFWLFTGTFLWLTKYLPARDNETEVKNISWLKSFLIGCAQAVAILPGVSRSGSTMTAGMFLKVDKIAAAKFAFLMAIPAIAGGAILKVKDIAEFPKDGIPQLIIGTIVSFVVAYISIKWLLSLIQKGKFWWFGTYCWVAGLATIAYFSIFHA